MQVEFEWSKVACRIVGGMLAGYAATAGVAVAYPYIDPSNLGTAAGSPFGQELDSQDARGLRDQARLLNPPLAGDGWRIVPRLTIQEIFTDNALEVRSPRRFDAITAISPGISIAADTARVQLTFDYQPSLLLHAINGPLNALTQQLSLTGIITVVPDLAYIDIRGVTGVLSRNGGLGGYGTLGSDASLITANSLSSAAIYGSGGQELNRLNSVQTSSFAISPYLLRQFGEYGVAKVGVSGSVSRYSSIDGFAASPFPTGGKNGQSLYTTEEFAQFTTGEILGRFQDTTSIDFSQSSSRFDSDGTIPAFTSHSRREIFNNQLSYALNRTFTLLGSIGHEYIYYGQLGTPTINGMTWSVGVTVTPNPDSSITVTYGHQNGANAFAANGRYAMTARTLVSFDYSETIGTQLENLQRQLNTGVINPNGQFVNAQTGGPLFVSTNAAGVQNGLFRYRTFNASSTTVWDRDMVSAAFTWSDQSRIGGSGVSTDIKTAAAAWTHELSPDMLFSAGLSYSLIRRANAGGNDNAFSTAVGLQYALNETTRLSARYSFFDRISSIQGNSIYENVLVLGVTKHF